MRIVCLPKGSIRYSSSSPQCRAKLDLGLQESPKETCSVGISVKVQIPTLPQRSIQRKEVRAGDLGAAETEGGKEGSQSEAVIGQHLGKTPRRIYMTEPKIEVRVCRM